MHLDLTRSGAALGDAENFRELDVRAAADLEDADVARQLNALGADTTQPGHAWLPARVILDRGRADDPEWRAEFDAMLAYADGAGWTRVDADGQQLVRAHIVHAGR